MKPEQDDNSIHKVAWSLLIVGAIVLGTALAWKWHSHAEAKVVPIAASSESGPSEAQPPTDAMQPLTPPRAARTLQPLDNDAPVKSRMKTQAKESHILENDPGLIDREAKMLRAEAAASEKSAAGPSSLALTEEQIKEIEEKHLILQ